MPSPIPLLAIAAPIAVAAAAIAVVVFLRFRRSGSPALHALGDVDKAIIEKLVEKGGSALQSELQKELGVPKTTLWRHIKKLEKLGFVRIEKEATFNRVVLLRRP